MTDRKIGFLARVREGGKSFAMPRYAGGFWRGRGAGARKRARDFREAVMRREGARRRRETDVLLPLVRSREFILQRRVGRSRSNPF